MFIIIIISIFIINIIIIIIILVSLLSLLLYNHLITYRFALMGTIEYLTFFLTTLVLYKYNIIQTQYIF